jgi:hypothetical protein
MRCIIIGLIGAFPLAVQAQSLALSHFSFGYYSQSTRFSQADYPAFVHQAPYATILPSPQVYQSVKGLDFQYRQQGLALMFGFAWQAKDKTTWLEHGIEIGCRNGFERPAASATGARNVVIELKAQDPVPQGQQGRYTMALRGNNLGISLGYHARPTTRAQWLQLGAAAGIDLPVSKNLESYGGGEQNRQLIHSYFIKNKYSALLEAYAQAQWKSLYVRYSLGYHHMALEGLPMGQGTQSVQFGLSYQI